MARGARSRQPGLDLEHGVYRTVPPRSTALARLSPTLNLYLRFIPLCFRFSLQARQGRYDGTRWAWSSQEVRDMLESSGVRIEVTGLEHVRDVGGPCVIAGNHMSMLETFVIPGLAQPIRPITFTVKKSLVEYPVFKDILLTRDPIVVSREDPRADFQTVMEGGARRLRDGISIVIFPQSTRMVRFDRTRYNSIAVKLAKRAKVPLIPLALRTDAWAQGRWGIKDFGPIHPDRTVHIAFGAPMRVTGRGEEAHAANLRFIEDHLTAWGLPPQSTSPSPHEG